MSNLKKALSTILATSICLTTIVSFQSLNISAESNQEPIKILPVGDSITDGYWENGSYRKYMYNMLTENGFNIDMVGDKGSNEQTSDGLTYDNNYCGYSGYAIQHITGTEERQGIYEVLVNGNIMKTYNPDIVLLQIGTNDILSAYNDGIIERLENLVNYILSYMEDDTDTLFVTTIPNIDVAMVESWLWAYGWGIPTDELITTVQDYIDSYNSQIKTLVERKQSEGCINIQFADINSVVDYETDLYDGVHPNEQGYKKMGEYWSQVLTSYLNGENINPDISTEAITTEITTTEAITTETTTTEAITTETTTTEAITTEIITTETTTTEIITTTEPIQDTYPMGDINRDGEVSNIDLLMLKKHILINPQLLNWIDKIPLYDLNSDSKVDIIDVIKLKSILLGQ